jgi:hypothetical protein
MRFSVPALLLVTMAATAQDNRQLVEFPDPMRAHMLANMRDHLVAIETITRQLAAQQYDEAADVAENRLGMSSLQSHGASHMARFMPKEMQGIGTAMHRAASRFALVARDAELEGGLHAAFSALSEVMQQCVACHSSFRVHP